MAELKHGRLAMLGVVGCLVQEAVTGKGPVESILSILRGNVSERREAGSEREWGGGRENQGTAVFSCPPCKTQNMVASCLSCNYGGTRACFWLVSFVGWACVGIAAVFSRPLLLSCRSVYLGTKHDSTGSVLDHHKSSGVDALLDVSMRNDEHVTPSPRPPPARVWSDESPACLALHGSCRDGGLDMAYRLRHAWASSIPPLPAPLTPRRNAYRPACSLDCLPACLPTCWPACLPVFARRG